MARPYVPAPGVRPPQPPPAKSVSPWAIILPIAGVLAVAAIVAVFVALPIVLRSRCIGMAADHGVTLSLDHVDIGLGEVRLIKVAFGLDGVPQISGHADDAVVTLAGFTPSHASLDGLSLNIDGSVDEIERGIAAWHAGRGGGGKGAPTGMKITFAQGQLKWARPFGAGAKLETADAGGEIDVDADSVHVTAEHLTVASGDTTLGPWRTTLERDAAGTRVNIELDPVVHGGPSVLYVRSPSGVASVSAKIPSSPLSRLGFPAKSMHLGSDPTIEAQVSFEEVVGGAATLTSTLALTHAVFSGFPVDVALKLHAAGDVTRGLDVKEGSLKAGPLTATVTGTIKLFDEGARVALGWTTRPVACAEVGKQLATKALGAQLGSLAQDVGGVIGLRVAGEAQASGLITIDTRDVSATNFGMTANETCGLAMF